MLERGVAPARPDLHGRTALQLAFAQNGGVHSGVTRRLAKQRWAGGHVFKGQYRMDTRVEWRGCVRLGKCVLLCRQYSLHCCHCNSNA